MKLTKNQKRLLSLMSIGILLSIVILVPKKPRPDSVNRQVALPPRIGARHVPPPTPEPEVSLIEVVSQPPGNTIAISRINVPSPLYVEVYKNATLIGESELLIETEIDLEIELTIPSKNGDVLLIKVLDQSGEELESKNILITTTVLNPSVIFPRDLRN